MAREVRNLALKSADAARSTGAIIQTSKEKSELCVSLAKNMEHSPGNVQTAIELNSAVVFRKTRIESFLHGIEADLAFLLTTPPVAGMLRARANGNVDPLDNSPLENWVARLEGIFSGFMRVKSYFRRIGFLDMEGRGLVCMESDGHGTASATGGGGGDHAAQQCLQGCGMTTRGNLFVSDLSLLAKNGTGTRTPVLHYAASIFDEVGRRQGVLVMEVPANQFLGGLRENGSGCSFFLVARQGNYLAHSDPSKEWSLLLGRAGVNMKSGLADAAPAILSGNAGFISDSGGRAMAFVPLYPRHRRPWRWVLVTAANGAWPASPAPGSGLPGDLPISGHLYRGTFPIRLPPPRPQERPVAARSGSARSLPPPPNPFSKASRRRQPSPGLPFSEISSIFQKFPRKLTPFWQILAFHL